MTFYLHNQLQSYFSNQTPLFEQLMGLQGECFRQLEGRTTQRIKLGEQYYFIKQHRGIGWKEVIKNILLLRLPVTGAYHEKQALEKLEALGINVPGVVGFGECGNNPAKKHSFILLQALEKTISLEDYCRHWASIPPLFLHKQRLISEVAHILKTMHENGVNHRDCYLCHFLLKQEESKLTLYVIDLHRAQVRKKTPLRWMIKDLAGLYFSALECGLTRRDYLRFICQYRDKTWRQIWQTERAFWQQVKERGEKLYRKHQRSA